eukprot:scaffold92551_cov32-Tisochrysis_lutea.AAC.1
MSITGSLCAFHARSCAQLFCCRSYSHALSILERPAERSCGLCGWSAKAVISSASLVTESTRLPLARSSRESSSPQQQTRVAPPEHTAALPPVYNRPYLSNSEK